MLNPSQRAPVDPPRGWAEVAGSSNGAAVAESLSSLRPPPGLGPPPGFASHLLVSPESRAVPPSQESKGFALDFSSGFDESIPLEQPYHSRMPSEASSNSGESPYIPGTMFSQPHLSRDNSAENIPSLGMLMADSLNILGPPEEAKDEFNVLDFLDGILNDGSAPGKESSPPSEPFDSSLATTLDAVPICLSQEPAVPANPWAGGTDTAASSRASLYGISLNDNNGSQETMNYPLLTPQAILNDGEVEEGEEELERTPLYARFHQK